MALIKCSECGKEISDKAEICVNCGNPIQKEIENQKKKNKKSLFQTFLLIAFILCTIILIIEIFNNKNMIIRDVDIYKSNLTTDQYGFLKKKKLYLIDLIYLLIKTICLIFPCISFLYYYLCMNYNIKIKKIANVIVIIHIVIFVLFLIAMKNNDTNCIIHYAENCIRLHKNIYFIAYNIITMLIELFTIKKLNKSIYEVATDF